MALWVRDRSGNVSGNLLLGWCTQDYRPYQMALSYDFLYDLIVDIAYFYFWVFL